MNRHPQFALTCLCVLVLIGSSRLSIAEECSEIEYGGTVTLGSAPDDDWIERVAVDDQGNVIIAGIFENTVDFDPSGSIDEYTSRGEGDVFVSKYSVEGKYTWTRTFGSIDPESIDGIAVTGEGEVLISGRFYNEVDFDPSECEDIHTSNGSHDIFVAKFLADGGYAWTRTFGGLQAEGSARLIYGDGGIFIVGCFNDSVDFDPSAASEDMHISAGADDVFLSKWTHDGDYEWTVIFGSDDFEGNQEDLGLDDEGNIYITAPFQGTVDFDPSDNGVVELTSQGNYDICLVKLTPDGSLIWARSFGGIGLESTGGLLVDDLGNVLVTGNFDDDSAVDFDPTEGIDERTSNGSTDIFVTKLSSDGTYIWTWTAGGIEGEFGYDLVSDTFGGVLITGNFGRVNGPSGYIVDFDAAGSGDPHSTIAGSDVYLTRLTDEGEYEWTYTFGGTSNEEGFGVAVTQTRDILVVGYYSGISDFDPTDGSDHHFTSDRFDYDGFLSTLPCSNASVGCQADVNEDGVVDPLDSGFVMSRFDCPVGSGDAECDAADANYDLVVDPLDVGFVLSRFGMCIEK